MSVWMKRFVVAATAASILVQSPCTSPALAGGYQAPWAKRTTVEQLAEKIDKLGKHIDEYGTVVAKHPDVWGDGRLAQHRIDLETQISKELGTFQFMLQGLTSQPGSRRTTVEGCELQYADSIARRQKNEKVHPLRI